MFLVQEDLTGISYLDMHQKFLAPPMQENANLYETRQSTTPFSFRGEGILQHEAPHCLNQSNRSNNMVPQGHQIFFYGDTKISYTYSI
jgi:hypothetical protein